MASDQVVSRELKSLQEELSAAQRERSVAPAASPTQPSAAAEESPVGEDKRELRDQLGELANAVTGFLEEAEKDIAAHPAQSVIGALVVGILIGRLLGRRGGGA
jgi:ElaB/YqjD/DUF883 family membrane-anchored ribosome-binding protein